MGRINNVFLWSVMFKHRILSIETEKKNIGSFQDDSIWNNIGLKGLICGKFDYRKRDVLGVKITLRTPLGSHSTAI